MYSPYWRCSFSRGLLVALAVCLSQPGCASVVAQETSVDLAAEADAPAETPSTPGPADRVEVEPTARDDEIETRLAKILSATGWFTDPRVTVDEGVVFLDGRTIEEEYKLWAAELARKTEGVVAVVNRLDIITPTWLDFRPARVEFESLLRSFIRALPFILVGILILVLAWWGARITGRLLRRSLRGRIPSNLLREVTSRTVGALVFVLGLYLVLRISGLSRLAVTVVGGTGLVGLVLGIAFRDITENFLASLVLSLQQPFREGDLVEIGDTMGYVQRLTSRTTVLMSLNGNVVQIPNAAVFKSTIRNYSSNPNWRQDFTIGISYNDSIPHAQEVALQVLNNHPAVLRDPEPWVLVDSLSASTVVLRVYFWLDVTQHSWLKLRSSVIRLVKRAFQDSGITLPDEAREVVFPDGVPVRMLSDEPQRRLQPAPPPPSDEAAEAVSTSAEANLQTESNSIREQARRAWSPNEGENLLTATDSNPVDGS